jgi:hypothetical protein
MLINIMSTSIVGVLNNETLSVFNGCDCLFKFQLFPSFSVSSVVSIFENFYLVVLLVS